MQFAQICDRVETNATNAPLDLSAFPGLWVNANPNTSGIARIVMSEVAESPPPHPGNPSGDPGLSLQTFAIGPEGLIDWGAADAVIFTTGPGARLAAGFASYYEFGFAAVRLQGMIMKGLLVLAQFHSFKDGSGRADYFAREYYALNHGRY